ncbi:MAG: hypothetical protein ABJZ55_21930 [Fuerstiella sp.]
MFHPSPTMQETMKVIGCDFGASSKAGLQAKKTILIEAERVADKTYRCHDTGRNKRLVSHRKLQKKGSSAGWKHNRAGWTIADLADSLANDASVMAAGFDFPFSIPVSLLQSATFAQVVQQQTFGNRTTWVAFLKRQLTLHFETEHASSTLTCLRKVDAWKRQTFWQNRQTDQIAKAQPPLKHVYQNVFNMTLLGNLLLAKLEVAGFTTVLSKRQLGLSIRPCVEAYPALVAKRIGVMGSYKQQPQQCIQKAVDWLAQQGITLQLTDKLKTACETYQTAENDFDAADALLCLVTSICVLEGQAEILVGSADETVQLQEGGIVVPAVKS